MKKQQESSSYPREEKLSHKRREIQVVLVTTVQQSQLHDDSPVLKNLECSQMI